MLFLITILSKIVVQYVLIEMEVNAKFLLNQRCPFIYELSSQFIDGKVRLSFVMYLCCFRSINCNPSTKCSGRRRKGITGVSASYTYNYGRIRRLRCTGKGKTMALTIMIKRYL